MRGIQGSQIVSSSTDKKTVIGGDNQITLEWSPRSDGQRSSSDSDSRECTAEVCLSIENVDTDAGTLDIYMINSEALGGWQFCTHHRKLQLGCYFTHGIPRDGTRRSRGGYH